MAVALAASASATSAQVTPFGSPSPASDGFVPVMDPPSAVYVDGLVTVDLTGPPNTVGWMLLGTSNTSWAGLPLPLDLTLFGPALFDGTLLVAADVPVPVQFDQDGQAEGEFFGCPVGVILFGQLATADPAAGQVVGAMSHGWSFSPQPGVAITGLSTTSVGAGSALDVLATDLPAEAKDLCVLGRDSTGAISAFMTAEDVSAQVLNADVAAITTGASEAFVTVMTGQGRYLDEGFAPPGIDYGPEDVRIWTSNGTPAEQFPVPLTLQPSPADTCTDFYDGGVGPSGAIEITVPSTTVCPPNTRFELQIDADTVMTMFDGGTCFEYVGEQSNSARLTTADCAIAACTVFQQAFLDQHSVLVFCNTSTDAFGNVTIKISPPLGDSWGSFTFASFRICSGE